ncbi:hypothetical protein IU433_00955 [Nocardia puris]|uniref:PH (Pleckstrin Homology) domain-containing protein n=1 Tax=Nocardia puris TaxID=208602 RepID=A0A366DV31_9NOCA|nr:hypothetical protein [Nocardia puris]MBF6210352.1 hypothetical protein [Nocardia puris]MBF6367427.1 hypothetical protein [Nocardia puris]MBF6457612.1 hypothetical protein [Nocardia puris]RBO93775.1 hypothetical protein DFR74_102192 [Nocardia puris]
MVEVEVTRRTVTFRVVGSHRLWALRRTITVPSDAIGEVARAEPELRPPWLRAPGTYLPKVIAAGTYRDGKGRKEFWDTTFRGKAIRVDLASGPFTRLVVDVDNPDATIRKLIRGRES